MLGDNQPNSSQLTLTSRGVGSWKKWWLVGLAIGGFSLGMILTRGAFLLDESGNFLTIAGWSWSLGMLWATLLFYLPIKTYRQRLLPEILERSGFTVINILLGLGSGTLWFYGIFQLHGGTMGFLDQNIVVWSFILGVLFLRERFSRMEIGGILVTVLGLGLISTLPNEVPTTALMCILGGGFLIAIQSLVLKKYTQKFSAAGLTFWRGWGMALGGLLLAGVVEGWEIPAWPVFLVGGVAQFFGLFAGRLGYIWAHRFFPMSSLSFMLLVIPVLVLSGSVLFFGEPLGLQKILGGATVLVGLGVFVWGKSRCDTHIIK